MFGALVQRLKGFLELPQTLKILLPTIQQKQHVTNSLERWQDTCEEEKEHGSNDRDGDNVNNMYTLYYLEERKEVPKARTFSLKPDDHPTEQFTVDEMLSTSQPNGSVRHSSVVFASIHIIALHS